MTILEYIKFAWAFYKLHTNEIVGIFTSAGAMFTAFVLIYTAKAANAAKDSTRVAQNTLRHATKNSKKDDFIRQFTLLLEQHNHYHDQLKNYLDTATGKDLLKSISEGTNHLAAFNRLRGHSEISPYMRVLYHLLRHIDVDFYSNGANLKGKKKYSSLVRSLIRNDIMLLVAVNASFIYENGEVNQFGVYQSLLKKFSFFEHALFFNINYDNSISSIAAIRSDFKKAGEKVKNIWSGYSLDLDKSFLLNDLILDFPRIPFIVSCIYENPMRVISMCYLNTFVVELRREIFQCAKYRYQNASLHAHFGAFLGASVISYSWWGLNESEKPEKLTEIEKCEKLNMYRISRLIQDIRAGKIKKDSELFFVKLNSSGLILSEYDIDTFISRLTDFEKYLNVIARLRDEQMHQYVRICSSYIQNIRANIQLQKIESHKVR
ncbi:TPA: hypothetical protein QHX34_002680 [Klebsiella aerogenes]|nr:hypothetical protein [Klebsiella aerogenes]